MNKVKVKKGKEVKLKKDGKVKFSKKAKVPMVVYPAANTTVE